MKIIFPVKVFQQFRAYVMGTKYEISGLGKIEILNTDEILIKEIKIFKQIVGGAETVMDRRALGKFYDDLIIKGEDLSKWKLWWHSHCDMEAFFSGQDTKTIEDFDSEMSVDNWMLSIVTNHNGKLLPRIDIFQPIRCTVEEIDWDITFEDKELESQILDEITEKVEIHRFNRHPENNSVDFNGQPRPRIWRPGTGDFHYPEEPINLLPLIGAPAEKKRIGDT